MTADDARKMSASELLTMLANTLESYERKIAARTELTRRLDAGERLAKACDDIVKATDPDSPTDNYRADDREGCLDYAHGVSKAALAAYNATEDTK